MEAADQIRAQPAFEALPSQIWRRHASSAQTRARADGTQADRVIYGLLTRGQLYDGGSVRNIAARRPFPVSPCH